MEEGSDNVSAAYGEMQRLVREQTPPKPSTKLAESLAKPGSSGLSLSGVSLRALRGDLDWMVLRALEKDPGQYAAAADQIGLRHELFPK